MTDPACMTVKDVADHLGFSLSAFYRRRVLLEAEGFPKIDPLLGRYLREDVKTWLQNRRQVRDQAAKVEGSDNPRKVNLDAI